MFYKTRLLLSLFVLGAALAACGDNDNETAQATSPEVKTEVTSTEATEPQLATPTALPTGKIEAGMSEQAVTDLLGAATLTQTHTLDTLTITHSEWTDETGTTSVQFQNGIVQFNQFTPANK